MKIPPWAAVALAAAALILCYAVTLRGMFDQWSNDEDMGHGFAVPVVVLWIVWRERQRWQALPAQGSWWGVPILVAGTGMHVISVLGAGLFAGSVALVVSIIGALVFLGGFARLRAWAFPLLLLLFMLPKLAVVYNQVTLPLQLLASRLAATLLTVSGVGVIREGNILEVAGHRVAVAEACSGIRYLIPLSFTALVFAYLFDPKPWMRAALLAAAVPLAILANAVRVAAVAYVPALESGFAHTFAGWLLFMFCLAALVVMQRAIHGVYALSRR